MISNYTRFAQGHLNPYRKISVKIYSTIDELLESHFSLEGVGLDEIESIGGILDNGEIHEFSLDDFKESIEELGIWGFSDEDENIHVWYEKTLGKDIAFDMIQFFSHEYAHLTESIEEEEDELLRSEIRAEQFSDASVFALNMTFELLGIKKFPRM